MHAAMSKACDSIPKLSQPGNSSEQQEAGSAFSEGGSAAWVHLIKGVVDGSEAWASHPRANVACNKIKGTLANRCIPYVPWG